MAIRSYKNNTNDVDYRGQRVSNEDLSFFGDGLENVEFTADGNNVVVTKIYDGSNNLLNIKFEKATPPTDPATGYFYLRPDLEVKELGYQAGTFRVEYNFWKFMAGSDQLPGVFIKDISTSRTEVRILQNPNPNADVDLTLKTEFFNFANLVMDSKEFNVLLGDIFNDIDIGVTINKLDLGFLNKLQTDFGISDIQFADLLSRILIHAKETMLLKLLEIGFVGYNEFIRMFDTVMKESIALYMVEGGPSTTDANGNTIGFPLPLDYSGADNYEYISTAERTQEELDAQNAATRY